MLNKIKAVLEFPVSNKVRNVKEFYELSSYYRSFIPNFVKTAKPLSELKNVELN